MDEPYLVAAARYVELNPVRAALAADAGEWPWSSARPHLKGRDDRLVKTAPLLAMIAAWRALLDSAVREDELRDLREHGHTGRPLGSASLLDRLESMVGRVLRPQKGGRPSKLRKIP
jgi:putative transposase